MKTFLKEVLLPLLIALCLAAFFKPVYMADGVCDYFLMWLCVGFPFGIRRMCLWLVPCCSASSIPSETSSEYLKS